MVLKEYFTAEDIIDMRLEGYSKCSLVNKANQESWLFQTTRLSHIDKPIK